MNDFSEKPSAWKGPFQRANLGRSASVRETNSALPGTPPPVELEIPISQLPLAGPLFGNEEVPIVQNGITCRSTAFAVGASGQAPVYLNKVQSLVYPATVGQTVFSLSALDHYGNSYGLSVDVALHVTVGGIRYIQDDGTGAFGQYSVDLTTNEVILLVPFGTDPVVIVGDGDLVVFDIFNVNAQDLGGVASNLNTQALTITTPNVLPLLAFAPNGQMTIVYVNGHAFSDDSVPPSFHVMDRTIIWTDPVYGVAPGDEVVVAYSYNGPSGSSGGEGGGGSIFVGIPEAPTDGRQYGRQSTAGTPGWTVVAGPSTTTPLMDGTAAIGSLATSFALADHVHPTDVTRAAAASVPMPSITTPLMDGTATVGSLTTNYALPDHVHPTDATRYAASNPSGYQTAAQVTAALVPYAPLASPAFSGVPTVPTAAPATATPQAASTAFVGAAINAAVVNPNLLLNGDMRIWQYGGPQLGGAGLANIYLIDHWFGSGSFVLHNGCQNITPTGGILSTLPTGFPNYLMAYASGTYTPVAADHWQYGQWIEADLITKLLWGTSGALPVTLSFWAQASVAGQYSIAIMNKTRSRSYVAPYTIASANTWQFFTITIPGDTAGTWVTSGNDVGMYVYFCLGAGSTYTGASSVGVGWFAGTRVNVTGSVNVTTLNQALYFTGVKLEAGSSATPFTIGSLEHVLLECQRYYSISYQPAIAGLGGGPSTSSALGSYVGPTADATSKLGVNWMFPATMRSVPTISLVSPNTGTAGKAYALVAAVDLNAAATQVSVNSAYLSLSSVSVSAHDTIVFAAQASAEVTPTF